MKYQFVTSFLGSDTALYTEVGLRKGQALISTGHAGYLVYGPYIALKQGTYRVKVYGSADITDITDAIADVCMETGQRILTEQSLQATADERDDLLVSMSFTIEAEANSHDIEIRVRVGSNNNVRIDMIELYRVFDIVKVGIVVVTYGIVPTSLVNSVTSKHDCSWYVHHHGSKLLNDGITNLFHDKIASLYFHCENRGLSRSWNDGIMESKKSGNDITIVINDDVQFIGSGFDDWVQFILSRNDHGLIFLTGEEPQDDGTVIVRPQDFACFSFGPQAYKFVGAFDENFSPAYYEDSDYIMRAQLAGISIYTDERLLCRHKRSSTLKNNAELSEWLPAFWKKNRDYMIKKWGGDRSGIGTFKSPFNDSAKSIYIPFYDSLIS